MSDVATMMYHSHHVVASDFLLTQVERNSVGHIQKVDMNIQKKRFWKKWLGEKTLMFITKHI